MRSYFIILLAFILLNACTTPEQKTGPVKVTIEKTGEGYTMLRNGKPYFIKGARTLGTQYMDLIPELGGNSVRIGGGGDITAKLDTAQKYGLSVLFGLPVSSERNGFDYSDTAAVKKQFDKVMEIVGRYKNHPSILVWAIGNELDYVPDNPDYNKDLWLAVNGIAKAIHAVDPAHPVITVTGTGRKYKMKDIVDMLPDIDALGINTYGDIYEIPDWVRKYNLDKPYIITEWGPTGHWQVKQNKWGVPVEETSTEKAAEYLKRHTRVIANDPFCLGGYSFLWTQGRQERTHTWYNMFYDNGEPKEAVDVMQYVWTGEWPENRAPRIDSLMLDGQQKNEDIVLSPKREHTAHVLASDPGNDALTYEWEIYPENTEFGYAGHGEKRPQPLNNLIHDRFLSGITLTAPESPGNYRLFVYVRDEDRKIAVANIPFHVGK
ncbi:MAG TPA: glycoside hydrolase family 2 TIM barrel-domain containing protein [Bacteroidales bacterium]|nr:glycoside hydrolase family 2 TIM barrel-domain containing protein [Bacteroidales bacterium]